MSASKSRNGRRVCFCSVKFVSLWFLSKRMRRRGREVLLMRWSGIVRRRIVLVLWSFRCLEEKELGGEVYLPSVEDRGVLRRETRRLEDSGRKVDLLVEGGGVMSLEHRRRGTICLEEDLDGEVEVELLQVEG